MSFCRPMNKLHSNLHHDSKCLQTVRKANSDGSAACNRFSLYTAASSFEKYNSVGSNAAVTTISSDLDSSSTRILCSVKALL